MPAKDPELKQKQEELAQETQPKPQSKADGQCIKKAAGRNPHSLCRRIHAPPFVTCSKYVNKARLQDMGDEHFTCCLLHQDKQLHIAEQELTIKESAATASKDGRHEPATMTVRMVVMRDQKTGENVSILTNNWTKPAWDIAFYMCQRWGKSENFFKEALSWFNLDYHPDYDLKEMEEQPLVDNPDIVLIKKGIKALAGDVKELQKEIDLSRYKLLH